MLLTYMTLMINSEWQLAFKTFWCWWHQHYWLTAAVNKHCTQIRATTFDKGSNYISILSIGKLICKPCFINNREGVRQSRHNWAYFAYILEAISSNQINCSIFSGQISQANFRHLFQTCVLQHLAHIGNFPWRIETGCCHCSRFTQIFGKFSLFASHNSYDPWQYY